MTYNLRRTVLSAVLFPLYWALRAITTRTATQHSMFNGLVRLNVLEDEAGAVEALRRTLALIESAAPWHLAHLQRRVHAIEVTSEIGGFDPRSRVLNVSARTLRTQRPEWVASTIVFGVTSARLSKRTWCRRGHQLRLTRTCLDAQVRFLRRLPDTEELLVYLASKWDAQYWSPKSGASALDTTYASMGVPPWLRRIAGWVNSG
jgi:hypothetical protein